MRQEHTIEIFEGVEATVFTCYTPEEKPSGGFPLSNPYPGCEEEFYVEEVFIKSEDVTEAFTEKFLDEILEKVKDSQPEPDYEEMAKGKRWASGY